MLNLSMQTQINDIDSQYYEIPELNFYGKAYVLAIGLARLQAIYFPFLMLTMAAVDLFELINIIKKCWLHNDFKARPILIYGVKFLCNLTGGMLLLITHNINFLYIPVAAAAIESLYSLGKMITNIARIREISKHPRPSDLKNYKEHLQYKIFIDAGKFVFYSCTAAAIVCAYLILGHFTLGAIFFAAPAAIATVYYLTSGAAKSINFWRLKRPILKPTSVDISPSTTENGPRPLTNSFSLSNHSIETHVPTSLHTHEESSPKTWAPMTTGGSASGDIGLGAELPELK